MSTARFHAGDTDQTALCLQAFAVGLAGYAAIKVIAPTFYAFGDSRTPMLVTIGPIIVNAGTDYLFAIVFDMKTAGLALSTSCVSLVNFLLLLALMRRRIERIEAGQLVKSCAKILIASLVMSAATYGAHVLLSANRHIDVTGSIVVAVVVFGASCKLLRVEELGELFGC